MRVIVGMTVAAKRFRNAPARPIATKVFHNPPFRIKSRASSRGGFSQNRLTPKSLARHRVAIAGPGSIHPYSISGHCAFAPIRIIESGCVLLILIADLIVDAKAASSA